MLVFLDVCFPSLLVHSVRDLFIYLDTNSLVSLYTRVRLYNGVIRNEDSPQETVVQYLWTCF